jgi:deoxycytidine triphosphate deaminase
MKSNDFVLVKTIEAVNIPSEKIPVQEGSAATLLMLNVFPRTTLQRCGISFLGTKTDPGYKGQLIFGLKNVGGNEFRLELGARIANLVFEQVVGDLARPYEGPWSGGRVGTEGTEKQR